MKRSGDYLFVISLILVLSLSLVSAGWFSNIFGKISGNAPAVDSGDGGTNSGVTSGSSYASRYWSFFDGSGVSVYFRTERFFGSGGIDTIVNGIKQEYGLTDFNIVNTKCYFQDPVVCTNFTEVACSECATSKDRCEFVKLIVNSANIPASSSGAGLETGPAEEAEAGNVQYSLVCDSIAFADNKANIDIFDFSGEPILANKINVPTNYSLVSYEDKIYVVSSGALIALDASQKEIWRYETTTSGKGGIFYQPFVDEEKGILYVGASNGFLFSIDLNKSVSGAVLNWFSEYSGNVELKSMDFNSNYIVAGDSSKGLLLINRSNGNKILNYSDGKGLSYPFIYEDKVVLSGKNSISVFELTTLKPLWEEKFNVNFISPVFVDKGVVYAGSSYGFYALNLSSKEYIFSRVGGADSWPEARANPEHFFKAIYTQPVVEGDVIYLTGSGGTLFALNKSGYKIWYYSLSGIQRAENGGDIVYLSSPKIIGDYIIFSGGKNQATSKLYVLDKASGQELFNYTLDGQSSLASIENVPATACVNKIVSGPLGKKRLSWAQIMANLLAALKLNPPSSGSSGVTRNAWDVLPSTGCETDMGNCVKLENGKWVCDREFCTLYQTTYENGIPNGGILIPFLDSLKLISISNGVANINLTYSKKEISLGSGQKMAIGDSGKGILITNTGTNYIVFQVGKMEELGGSTSGGNTGDSKLTCSDSDGKNYGTYGWVNFTKETLSGGNNYQTGSYEDRCISGINYEAYCSGLLPQIETYTCPNGCDVSNKFCKGSSNKICGNGIIDGAEECDRGSGCNTTTCKCVTGFKPQSPPQPWCELVVVDNSNYYPAPFLVKGITDVAVVYSTLGSPIVYTDAQKIQNDLERRNGFPIGNVIINESKINEINSHNLIVVGSACENNFIKSLAGKTDCTQIKTALGLSSKDYLIKSYSNPFMNGKIILLVTGYGTEETSAAVNYLISSTTLPTSVGSIYRGKIGDSSSCSDPDSANPYYTQTTTYNSTFSGTDNCSGISLIEYYCQGASVKSQIVPCPSGYSCSVGACKSQDKKRNCSDSDGGYNLFEKGTLTWITEVGTVFNTDNCVDSYLNEYYCVNNDSMSNFTKCENGCENGACKTEGGISNCTRLTDVNYYQLTLGSSKITYANGTSREIIDSCIDNATKQFDCRNGKKDYTILNCASGQTCENGICKPFEGNNSIPTNESKEGSNSTGNWGTCIDSDGGVNLFVKGHPSINGVPVGGTEDHCITSGSDKGKIAEYYCTNKSGYGWYWAAFDCPNNGFCLNGVCDKCDSGCFYDGKCYDYGTRRNGVFNYDFCTVNGWIRNGGCYGDSGCNGEEICVNGTCKLGECSSTKPCANGKVCESGVCKIGNCIEDSDCDSGRICVNYTCKDKVVNSKIIDCTDNDTVPYQLTFGAMWITWPNGTQQTLFDSCVGAKVQEYQCIGLKDYTYVLSSCASGYNCIGGVCKLIPPSCEYPANSKEYYSPGSIIDGDKCCDNLGKVQNRAYTDSSCSENYQCRSNGCCKGKCQSPWNVFWGVKC